MFCICRGICVRTFLELRRHYERILVLVEMMSKGNESLPCFNGDPTHAISEMKKRFYPNLHDIAAAGMVNDLINQSLDNWTTTVYDGYQKLCQGIQ